MSYQVLARKWRPQTFAEVVGQEHIARTLKNALIHNRIGHAYLFVGSRGIGKTTSARIFAKALNCEHLVDGEPCCQCDSCKEIAAGNSLDVIEIDAASHNGVDDMRSIRDQVLYPPVKSKYKVYIIDEVHMLSPGAWNALLKTLEEPPEYVKFLFATTEPHKVLPTIISRCQRFDLHRIPVQLIVGRLRQIADAEKIFVEDNALAAIARAAEGGMRDAQSIFDQIISFCGGLTEAETIRESDVISIFGLASGAELRDMALGLLQNNLPKTLSVIAALADAGRDLERVFEDFLEYIRNLMLAGLCNDAGNFLEVSRDELQELRQIAAAFNPAIIRKVLATLVSQQRLFNDCLNKRIALEVVAAQVTTEVHSTNLDDVLTHLNVISGLIPKEEVTPRAPQPFRVKSDGTTGTAGTAGTTGTTGTNGIPSCASSENLKVSAEQEPVVPTEAPGIPSCASSDSLKVSAEQEPVVPTEAPGIPSCASSASLKVSAEQAPVVPTEAPGIPSCASSDSLKLPAAEQQFEPAPEPPVSSDASDPFASNDPFAGIVPAQDPEPTPQSALEKSGYRRASKDERKQLQSNPAVQTMMQALHQDPYDAIIPL